LDAAVARNNPPCKADVAALTKIKELLAMTKNPKCKDLLRALALQNRQQCKNYGTPRDPDEKACSEGDKKECEKAFQEVMAIQ
jgi:hypothetical protein